MSEEVKSEIPLEISELELHTTGTSYTAPYIEGSIEKSSSESFLFHVSVKSASIFVVGFAFFTDYLIMLAVIPILPEIGIQEGISNLQLGVLFAMKPAFQVVCNPLVGSLADRFGRKNAMICGLFALSGTTIMFALAKSFELLMIARCLQGIASATNAASMAFLADVFPESKERGVAISRAMTGISLGVMIGPLFGGWLYTLGGIQLPFFIAAGLVAIDGVLRILVPDPKPSNLKQEESTRMEIDNSLVSEQSTDKFVALEQEDELTFKKLLMEPSIVVLCTSMLIGNCTIAMMETLLPLLCDRLLNLSAGMVGVVYFCGTFAYLICALLVPKLTEFLNGNRWKCIIIGLVFQGGPLPLMPLIDNLGWIIPLWIIVSGIGMACIDVSINPQIADEVDTIFGKNITGYARTFGVAQSFSSVGFILGPIIGGALLDYFGGRNFFVPFIVFCSLNILFIPVVWFGYSKSTK